LAGLAIAVGAGEDPASAEQDEKAGYRGDDDAWRCCESERMRIAIQTNHRVMQIVSPAMYCRLTACASSPARSGVLLTEKRRKS
jgi:hypothetical protein